VEGVYSTPSKNLDDFSGLNPAINSSPTTMFEKNVSDAYDVIRNPAMIQTGQHDVLQSFLDELGLDSRETMQYLITVPEYMERIAEYLKPLGKIIFLQAIPAVSSPQKAKKVRSSPSKKQQASHAVKMVQDYLKDLPLSKQVVKSAASIPLTSARNPALSQIEAQIVAAETENAKLQIVAAEKENSRLLAAAATKVLHPPLCPELEALKARLAAIQLSNIALREENSTSADIPASSYNQMFDKVAASKKVPFPRTTGTYDCAVDNVMFCHDMGQDDNRNEGDSENDYTTDRKSSKLQQGSLALLQQQAKSDIRDLTEYWEDSSTPTYLSIMRAADTPKGLQAFTITGAIETGKFEKSLYLSGKSMHFKVEEAYGAPPNIRPSTGPPSPLKARHYQF
jgi:hypothetical protein